MIPIVSITEKEICIVFHTEGGIFFLKYAKTINKSKIIHTIFPLMDAEVFSARRPCIKERIRSSQAYIEWYLVITFKNLNFGFSCNLFTGSNVHNRNSSIKMKTMLWLMIVITMKSSYTKLVQANFVYYTKPIEIVNILNKVITIQIRIFHLSLHSKRFIYKLLHRYSV